MVFHKSASSIRAEHEYNRRIKVSVFFCLKQAPLHPNPPAIVTKKFHLKISYIQHQSIIALHTPIFAYLFLDPLALNGKIGGK